MHFGFSPEAMFTKAVEVHPKHIAIMEPGSLVSNPISAISLGLALMFGTAGLPHILMRFFTVADAKAARKSVFYATGLIGYFYILTFIIGFGAITLVATNPEFLDPAILAAKGPIAALQGRVQHGGHPSRQCGRRQPLPRLHLGRGLRNHPRGGCRGWRWPAPRPSATTSMPSVIKKGKADEQDEIRVSKIRFDVLGILAVILGIVFENQNVAFMVGLAFAIAASCNFPVLRHVDLLEGPHDRAAPLIGGFARPGLGGDAGRAFARPSGKRRSAIRRVRRRSPTTTRLCSRCPSRSSASGCSRCSTAASRRRASEGASTRSTCAPRPASARLAPPLTKAIPGRAMARPGSLGRTEQAAAWRDPRLCAARPVRPPADRPSAIRRLMGSRDAKSIRRANPPFDRLDPKEIETLRAAMDIGYYRPGEMLIPQGASADHLFVVIKGTVEERDGDGTRRPARPEGFLR